MATVIADNVEYRLIFGSDVINNGVYLEVQDHRLSGPPAILMAFRSDLTRAVTITAYEQSLSLAVVTKFLDAVRAEWPATG